jgi:hypothetical protein
MKKLGVTIPVALFAIVAITDIVHDFITNPTSATGAEN